MEGSQSGGIDEEAQVEMYDAFYVSYKELMPSAILVKTPTEMVLESIIGTDDRVRIQNPSVYPWRAICALRMTAKDGSRWIGTGFLVGPGTVITAGHCVYLHVSSSSIKYH